MAKNIEININNGSNSYETLYPKTLGGLVEGNVSGANTANTLAIARTIQTNLGSTSASSFNGSSNITPGVTGILSASNGGTGYNSLYNLAHYGLKNELNLIAYTGSRRGSDVIPTDSSPLTYNIAYPSNITPLCFYMSYEKTIILSPHCISKNNVFSDRLIGEMFNNIGVFLNRDSAISSNPIGFYENYDTNVISLISCEINISNSKISCVYRKNSNSNTNIATTPIAYLNYSGFTYYWTVIGVIV